jgi:hypothetical protein
MGADQSESDLGALLQAIQSAIADADAPQALARDPLEWLRRAGLSEPDAARLAKQGATRLLLYRKLVRRGLTNAIRIEIPRTAARLGERFDAWAARYLDEELPRSHYLRDVAFEFLAWAANQWTADPEVPDYLVDLARHELSAFEVANAPDDARGSTGTELALDAPVRFDPSSRVYCYAYAVHLCSDDEAARDEPPKRATRLFAYRDREHEVRYLEQSPLAGAIVARLLEGAPLGEAIAGACAELGQGATPEVLEGVASLLTDLAERGALLGASRPEAKREHV